MEISVAVMWLIAGLVLAGAEIFVGTFYFLVMGCACLGAALMAWLNFSLAWQFCVFAVLVLVGGVAVRYLREPKSAKESESLQNPDVGQHVTVKSWAADGTTTVNYRGAQWTATLQDGSLSRPGIFEIVRVEGARLVLKNVP